MCRASGLLLLLFLDKVQDIELANLAIRKEAVNGVLLVIEDLEDGCELGQYQQFDVPPCEIQEFQGATGLFQAGVADDQTTKPGTVDVIHIAEIKNNVSLPGFSKFPDLLPQRGDRFAHNQPAFYVQNHDSFAFSLFDIEGHSASSLSFRQGEHATTAFPGCAVSECGAVRAP